MFYGTNNIMDNMNNVGNIINGRWRTQVTPTYFTFLGVVDSITGRSLHCQVEHHVQDKKIYFL